MASDICTMTIQLHRWCCTVQNHDPVNYLLVSVLLSHSYQIGFKVGVCHPWKLNLFLILNRLSNIITLVIIPHADNLILVKGPSDAITRIINTRDNSTFGKPSLPQLSYVYRRAIVITEFYQQRWITITHTHFLVGKMNTSYFRT